MRDAVPVCRSRSLYPPQCGGIVQRSELGKLANVTDHRVIDERRSRKSCTAVNHSVSYHIGRRPKLYKKLRQQITQLEVAARVALIRQTHKKKTDIGRSRDIHPELHRCTATVEGQ